MDIGDCLTVVEGNFLFSGLCISLRLRSVYYRLVFDEYRILQRLDILNGRSDWLLGFWSCDNLAQIVRNVLLRLEKSGLQFRFFGSGYALGFLVLLFLLRRSGHLISFVK